MYVPETLLCARDSAGHRPSSPGGYTLVSGGVGVEVVEWDRCIWEEGEEERGRKG